MQIRVAAVLALALGTTAPALMAGTPGLAAPTCGLERWPVKTLEDPAGRALKR
jgi:hypothetical protein